MNPDNESPGGAVSFIDPFGNFYREAWLQGEAGTFSIDLPDGSYYAVTRFDLAKVLELTANSVVIGTALNLLWIVALPRYGRVIDPFDPANSGIKGVLSNKNSLGQFCAAGVMILLMARASATKHRQVYLLAAFVNLALLVRSDSKTSLVALIGVAGFAVVFRASFNG